MNKLIILAILVVSGNCQQAFESFMTRNRDLFSNVAPTNTFAAAPAVPQQQSFGPLPQPQAIQQPSLVQQWQSQPQTVARPVNRGRSLTPSVTFASQSNEPFVTSNSHIQAINAPQPSGSPTTISGPNFQTSITLPALPALPQHPAGSPAAVAASQNQAAQAQQLQQFQSFQPQPQSAPTSLTQQFSTQISSHQAPTQASTFGTQQKQFAPQTNSFFNTQNPFNFGAQASAARQFELPSLPNTNNFFTAPQQPQPQAAQFPFQSQQQQFTAPQAQQSPSPFTFSNGATNTIRAPGFETTFSFMQPSESPVSGAGTLSKLIRAPDGTDKQMYYSPMPGSYAPPSVYSYSTVHQNPLSQPQQQGQQQ